GAVYVADLSGNRILMNGEMARPHLTGVAASAVGTNYADLSGNVNPEGLPTEYVFEYGPTASYGSTFPVAPAELPAVAEDKVVGAHLTGIAPGATIHYQLVAENAEGRSESGDHTVTTYPAGGLVGLPDGRVYEMVSPPEKGGNDAEPHGLLNGSGMAGEGESGLLYSTLN